MSATEAPSSEGNVQRRPLFDKSAPTEAPVMVTAACRLAEADVRVRVPPGALATVPNGTSVQTPPAVNRVSGNRREGSTPSGASLLDGPVAERQTHHVQPLVRLA